MSAANELYTAIEKAVGAEMRRERYLEAGSTARAQRSISKELSEVATVRWTPPRAFVEAMMRVEISFDFESELMMDRDFVVANQWRGDRGGDRKAWGIAVYSLRDIPHPGFRIINPCEALK